MTAISGTEAIRFGRMGARQWAAVAVTVGLNALDGFDVLSISFASPSIAKDWGVDRAALGWILSMELMGMAIGSLILGSIADRIGRRPTILVSLVVMTLGMWGAGHAAGIGDLLGWRLLTGLGIGGMLAAINAAAAEFSNDRWRSLAMAMTVIGYPLGGILGGLVVQQLLVAGGWRDIFQFGALATACFIPLVWFLVPETIAYLERRQGPAALDEINRTLSRFGHGTVVAASRAAQGARHSVADILRPGLIATTMLMTIAYFAHIISFYYVLKWVPKIVADMGFDPSTAAGVLTWANVGGATGGALFGFLALRIGLKPLTMAALAGSFVMVVWFGLSARTLETLALAVGCAGFFTNSAIVGLYSLFARVFPTHVRATGTGFAIGIGRGGSALAPVAAGYLFQAGFGLGVVSVIMGAGSLVAIAALALLDAAPASRD